VELQGLSAPQLARTGHLRRPLRRTRALAYLLGGILAVVLALPSAASAWAPPGEVPQSAPPGTPTLVASMTAPPPGYRLTGDQVLAIARANPYVRSQLKKMPKTLVPYVYTRGGGVWQVSWFTSPKIRSHPQWEEVQVYVVDATGQVSQAWTGYQVAWTMARGYPGAFGRVVNHPWIWLPLCLFFVLPFIPWRRRPTLWHLDLLVLLGFSISLAFFNHADLGLSVPTVYPFMGYLIVRLGLLGFGIGRPREPLSVIIPTPWLAVLIVFLVGFRVGLNVTDSNVIDVGYAGTIGGYKLLHGQKLYGDPSSTACGAATTATDNCWPDSNGAGDTYGPVNYLSYVPAVAALGWSGVWDGLPASHAAAIAFDLLTLVGLFLLGRRVRGPSFGVVLAYLWAAYPFTLYVLSSNSNDSLVALLVVATLLVVTSAPARGIMLALAGLTKFAPLVLGPLMLRGTGEWGSWRGRAGLRRGALYLAGFVITLAVAMAPVLLNHDLSYFWTDTISYQTSRPAPFSVWGLWGDTFGGVTSKLIIEQRIWQALTVLAAFLVMVFPRGRRSLVQVAALGGALMIAVECSLTYWFYLYIVWFFPLVIVALVLAHPGLESVIGSERVSARSPTRARAPAPV
jgi:hypothetical protein